MVEKYYQYYLVLHIMTYGSLKYEPCDFYLGQLHGFTSGSGGWQIQCG